jgi:cysteine-rich secretory family protein
MSAFTRRTLLVAAMALGTNSFAIAAEDSYLRQAEQQIFRLANESRKDAGVEELQWNEQAAEAARAHAKLMAEKQALSHQFSGEPALRERMGATGLRFDSVAENVADAGSPDEVHKTLMNSPPHRQNLLNPKYNSLGIGVAYSGDQFYVVQDFAHALPTRTATEVEDEIISDFNRLRVSHGLPVINAAKSEELRTLACEGKQRQVHARDVMAAAPGASRVMAFTTVDPSTLPESLLNASREPASRMNVGACFAPSPSTSYAAFWVVVTMFR